jgi:hypothetical protein
MKSLRFATLNAYASQYPAIRSAGEISVWAWIAGAVVFVALLAALLSGDRPEHLLQPPIGQRAADIIAHPHPDL